MFGLAYAYLVDMEYGRGATIDDMKVLFQSMAGGDSFSDAFESVIGFSVPWYAEHFYDLMEGYLEESGKGSLRGFDRESLSLN